MNSGINRNKNLTTLPHEKRISLKEGRSKEFVEKMNEEISSFFTSNRESITQLPSEDDFGDFIINNLLVNLSGVDFFMYEDDDKKEVVKVYKKFVESFMKSMPDAFKEKITKANKEIYSLEISKIEKIFEIIKEIDTDNKDIDSQKTAFNHYLLDYSKTKKVEGYSVFKDWYEKAISSIKDEDKKEEILDKIKEENKDIDEKLIDFKNTAEKELENIKEFFEKNINTENQEGYKYYAKIFKFLKNKLKLNSTLEMKNLHQWLKETGVESEINNTITHLDKNLNPRVSRQKLLMGMVAFTLSTWLSYEWLSELVPIWANQVRDMYDVQFLHDKDGMKKEFFYPIAGGIATIMSMAVNELRKRAYSGIRRLAKSDFKNKISRGNFMEAVNVSLSQLRRGLFRNVATTVSTMIIAVPAYYSLYSNESGTVFKLGKGAERTEVVNDIQDKFNEIFHGSDPSKVSLDQTTAYYTDYINNVLPAYKSNVLQDEDGGATGNGAGQGPVYKQKDQLTGGLITETKDEITPEMKELGDISEKIMNSVNGLEPRKMDTAEMQEILRNILNNDFPKIEKLLKTIDKEKGEVFSKYNNIIKGLNPDANYAVPNLTGIKIDMEAVTKEVRKIIEDASKIDAPTFNSIINTFNEKYGRGSGLLLLLAGLALAFSVDWLPNALFARSTYKQGLGEEALLSEEEGGDGDPKEELEGFKKELSKMITSFLNEQKMDKGNRMEVSYSEESVELILNEFLVGIKSDLKTGKTGFRVFGNIGKVMKKREGDDLVKTGIKNFFSDNKLTRLMDTFVDFDDRFPEVQELLLEKNALKVLLSNKDVFQRFASTIEPSLQKNYKMYDFKNVTIKELIDRIDLSSEKYQKRLIANVNAAELRAKIQEKINKKAR